jgi:hypothetical protein
MGPWARRVVAVRAQLAGRAQSEHQQALTVVQALCIVGRTMGAAAEAPKAVHIGVHRIMVAPVELEEEVVGRVLRTARTARRVRRTRVVEEEDHLEFPAARPPTKLDALEERASALFRILSRNHILLT